MEAELSQYQQNYPNDWHGKDWYKEGQYEKRQKELRNKEQQQYKDYIHELGMIKSMLKAILNVVDEHALMLESQSEALEDIIEMLSDDEE